MTLIVGIRCSDGIAVAADGAATFGNLSQHTIRQSVRKLTVANERIIIGTAGPVGTGQRIVGELTTLVESGKLSTKKPHEMGALIRQELFDKIWGVELKIAAVARESLGPQGVQSTLSHTLVAVPVKGTPCLFQFDHAGNPEMATPDLPFVAIGSGQSIADPFLAFLKRIYWGKREPNLQEGILTALWTLDHAIKTNPGGVSEPVQVAVLACEGKECKAREIADEELREHTEAISAAERTLADYLTGLNKPPAEGEIQPVPSP